MVIKNACPVAKVVAFGSTTVWVVEPVNCCKYVLAEVKVDVPAAVAVVVDCEMKLLAKMFKSVFLKGIEVAFAATVRETAVGVVGLPVIFPITLLAAKFANLERVTVAAPIVRLTEPAPAVVTSPPVNCGNCPAVAEPDKSVKAGCAAETKPASLIEIKN